MEIDFRKRNNSKGQRLSKEKESQILTPWRDSCEKWANFPHRTQKRHRNRKYWEGGNRIKLSLSKEQLDPYSSPPFLIPKQFVDFFFPFKY